MATTTERTSSASTIRSTLIPRPLLALFLTGFAALAGRAAELKPETRAAWDEYAKSVEDRVNTRPPSASSAHGTEIVVEPAPGPNPKRVPNGLIHHWTGAVFIPGTDIDRVLAVVRNYARYPQFYKPGILEASLTRRNGLHDNLVLVFANPHSPRTAVECTYQSTYVRVDARHWYSISRTDHTQQIDDYGTPHQHKLPIDQGNGYLWRLNRIAWYEERDEGVYVNVEAVALSRDVPSAIRWLAMPIIRRIARETLAEWLTRTRSAVTARAPV